MDHIWWYSWLGISNGILYYEGIQNIDFVFYDAYDIIPPLEIVPRPKTTYMNVISGTNFIWYAAFQRKSL